MLICLVSITPSSARDWPESRTATIYSQGARIPYLPSGGTESKPSTCQGASTQLRITQVLAKMPRHDVDLGRTTLTLLSLDGKKELLKETFTEVWECLGYNPTAKRYVLITKNEHGTKVTLRGLVYLEENPARFKDSVFGEKQFEAAASLPGPDGNYLALIGAPEGEDTYKLYVLNLVADKLQLLGDAPGPPPLTKEDLEWPEALDMMAAWEAPERHYTELEPGIWSFTNPSTLQVSYGKDTYKARNKKRSIKTWDLKSLFKPI
ncbi:MAG: hypothetical protein AB1439_00590 [candidate division FCPU426 bacterium]